MTSDAEQAEQVAETQAAGGIDADGIKIQPPRTTPDFTSIFGLIAAMGLIIAAIAMGGKADFLNAPSFMIVILGTIAAVTVSYSGEEMKNSISVLGHAIIRHRRNPSVMAKQMMDIATVARKTGILALAKIEGELGKDPFLLHSVQLVTDGYSGEDINRILGREIDTLVERHRRGAGMLRRASEVAPAMGLIGTLVGLVQMLAQLSDPSSIGPAMAVALLTTFYGAILGTVIMGPMAAKLERNSSEEAMVKNIVLTALISIAEQENPRRLEIVLNSELPPDAQIRYFD